MRNWIKAIASVGFLGYIPIMSGTVTSAIFAFIIYKYITNLTLYCFFGALAIVLGFLVSGWAAFIYNMPDPRKVVIDELAGLFVALFLIPHDLKAYLIAFLIFRALDIFKPPPIISLEKIKGSAGIMLDDLLAGLFANIATQLLLRFVLK